MHRVLAIDVDILKLVVIGLAVLHVIVNELIGCAARWRAFGRDQRGIDLHILSLLCFSTVEIETRVVNLGLGGPFNNYFLNVKIIHVNVTIKIKGTSKNPFF